MYREFEKGLFIEECKCRFLCKVWVKGIEELCYVSSSSKLRYFIELKNKEVVLKINTTSKSKTKYTLFAVKDDVGYILLDLVYVNKLLHNEFIKPISIYFGNTIYCEKVIENLRSDFYIDGKNKVFIEAKGIITKESTAYFPSMVLKRAINQLKVMRDLLAKGYKVHYYLVLMSPQIDLLLPNRKYVEYYNNMKLCLENGMQLFVYKIAWNDIKASVFRDQMIEKLFLNEVIK